MNRLNIKIKIKTYMPVTEKEKQIVCKHIKT